VSREPLRWLLLLALAACRRQEGTETSTSVLVTVQRAENVPPADYLSLKWVGGGHSIEGQKAPRDGTPLPNKTELGQYRILIQDPVSPRTIVATAIANGDVVAEGGVRAEPMANTEVGALLILRMGRMPDGDRDGIPDEVDNCSHESNPDQGPCVTAPPGDAGAEEDGGPPDAGVPPDAEPPPDATQVPPDARPDTAPIDLGSGKTARGGACVSPDECETGRCADSRVGKFCASTGMLVVPAGQFARGCLNKDTACAADERPQKMVMVSGFELNQTEVTQGQYDACVKAGVCPAPSGFNPTMRPNHPVGNVTWTMANTFCTWSGKRLPTEAEWEKAARGPASNVYPWGDEMPTVSSCALTQFKACGLADSVPVGTLTGISGYGIEDMAGNVAEWVSDFYASNYYAGAPATDPTGAASGMHLRRGGGFTSDPPALRTSARAPSDAATASGGFRCARSL
jgi:hypothetical protein